MSGRPAVVPVHPERTPDPATLRWYLADAPAGIDPRPLATLVAGGMLAGFEAGAGHVDTTLAPGRAWAETAAAVRRAVQDAVLEASLNGDHDAVAARPAAGDGGPAQAIVVRDVTVADRIPAACRGCPAAPATFGRTLAAGGEVPQEPVPDRPAAWWGHCPRPAAPPPPGARARKPRRSG